MLWQFLITISSHWFRLCSTMPIRAHRHERELGWVDPRLLGSDRVVQELGYNCHFVLPMERVEMEEIELSKIQSHNCNCKPKEQASKGTGSSQWTTPLAAYIKQMFNRPNRAHSFHSQIMK
ncbi:hypothetical protein T11_17677 [Trichinella zimbabwensis]|uniref:Uncharacterized protein n=1 Tax=Trichinella zimbabwensis TaxID=268475 RepID=A0A0V1H6A0_9BILA|nr:hypothetical protein T11_17677 [Trichinella zimbabwensis]